MSTQHHENADEARKIFENELKANIYPGILTGVEKLLHQKQYLQRLERAHNHKSYNFSSFVNDIRVMLALCSSCVIYLSSFKSGKATRLLWDKMYGYEKLSGLLTLHFSSWHFVWSSPIVWSLGWKAWPSLGLWKPSSDHYEEERPGLLCGEWTIPVWKVGDEILMWRQWGINLEAGPSWFTSTRPHLSTKLVAAMGMSSAIMASGSWSKLPPGLILSTSSRSLQLR